LGLKVSGFDELKNELKRIEKAAKDLEGTHSVNMNELFIPSFMSRYTNFSSFDEFIEASGFTVNSQEDFESIPDAEMDKYVQANTQFASWQEMLDKSVEEYTVRKLGL